MNEGKQPRPHIDRAEGDRPDPEMVGEARESALASDEALQKKVLSKISERNQKGKWNRMAEVQTARDQRLYMRNIFYFHWSEDAQDIVFDSDDTQAYERPFPIYQGYAKIFISAFMGARAKVRAEADDPKNSLSIRNTSKAQLYERVYRKNNDNSAQQLEIGRLMVTDGRIVTRLVRNSRGDEITEFWGILESRLPAMAKVGQDIPLENCLMIELEDEYPIAQLKSDYPDAVKNISSGAGDSYERNARMTAKRNAGSDTAIDVLTGEDSSGMATKTWTYLRPAFYEEFDEATKETLLESYPAGLCVIHNGDTYLDSEECDIDATLDVIHALPGDGQCHGSVGHAGVSLQDSANTAGNLIEETLDHGIPTTYWDQATNIDGLNKQREMPGASRKMVRKAGEPAADHFFQTETLTPPQALINHFENVRGPMSQFVFGTPPAIYGAEMEDQKTASGYAQARNQALGQLIIVWKPFTCWYTRENTRAIRMASQRDSDIRSTLDPVRRGGRPQNVKIAPSDLRGLSFTNSSDENFPQTWTERSNKFLSLLQMGGEVADWILESEPDNLYFAKEMLGLEELTIPGEALRNKVLADIAQMEHEKPEPDPTWQPPQGQMLPPVGAPPLDPPKVSSIIIDPDYLEDSDYAIGYHEVKRWILTDGLQVKESNKDWFENVRLYGLQYKKGMQQAAQNSAPQPEQKPMALSGNYKDLPPAAQAAALQRDGLPAGNTPPPPMQ